MDRDDFGERFTAISESLYRVARSMLRAEDDCRDALCETALRAWERRGSLRDEEKFDAWVFRILINECRAIHRRQRRIVLTDAFPEVADPSQRDIFDSKQVISGTFCAQTPALDALMSLSEALRLPTVLHYVEGYSVEETAAILRVPKSTVRGRLSRARAALRLELEVSR